MAIHIKEISKEQTWELRHQVMWPTKHVDYIKLMDDDVGYHFGLFSGNKLVSVVSLFIEKDVAQFRKFATLQEEQGKGYGSTLLAYVLREAKKRGVNSIWCNARTTKASFYKRFGFEETHNTFTKGGQLYVIMDKTL